MVTTYRLKGPAEGYRLPGQLGVFNVLNLTRHGCIHGIDARRLLVFLAIGRIHLDGKGQTGIESRTFQSVCLPANYSKLQ